MSVRYSSSMHGEGSTWRFSFASNGLFQVDSDFYIKIRKRYISFSEFWDYFRTTLGQGTKEIKWIKNPSQFAQIIKFAYICKWLYQYLKRNGKSTLMEQGWGHNKGLAKFRKGRLLNVAICIIKLRNFETPTGAKQRNVHIGCIISTMLPIFLFLWAAKGVL